MALAMIAEVPDLTREQYEAVVRKVAECGAPAGAVFHAGGPIEGGYRIVEVWETREAADAFYQSESLRKATSGFTTEARVTMTWQVYGLDNGSGWHVTR